MKLIEPLTFVHDGKHVIYPAGTAVTEVGNDEDAAYCKHRAEALPMFSILAKAAIVFCSYHWVDSCIESLGGIRKALLTWHKRNSPASVQNSPWYSTELAWVVQFSVGVEWRTVPASGGACSVGG